MISVCQELVSNYLINSFLYLFSISRTCQDCFAGVMKWYLLALLSTFFQEKAKHEMIGFS